MKNNNVLKITFFIILGIIIFNCYNVSSEETTIINVEFPTENCNIKNSVEISGWKLSREEHTSIKIFIGNTEIENVNYILRPDVMKVVKGYGDETTNPTPGFKNIIDVSDYLDGNYPVIVKVVNNEGNTIKEIRKNISIKKNNVLTNIENINRNIDGNMLNISGWKMTDLANHKLALAIDNDLIENINITNIKRPDVIRAIKGYGDETTNPTPGFNIAVDMSKYKDGYHKISLRIINENNNETIENKNFDINLKKSKSLMNLETPASNQNIGGNLNISGWVMTTDINNEIRIKIDGNEIDSNLINRIKRNDVIRAVKGYGDEITNPTPGFKIDYDTSLLSDGNHVVRVELVNKNTNEIISVAERNIKVGVYKTLLNVESPNNLKVNSNSVKVSGWIMSTNKNQALRIKVDEDIYEPTRFNRKDVINAIKDYGNEIENPTPGFEKVIDLSKYKNGNHTILVEAYDNRNNKILATKKMTITLNKYKSLLNIETSNNSNAKTSVNIEGWIMTTNSDYSIKIYIDNQEIASEIKKIARPDVNKAIKDYGENELPGFKSTLDLKSIKDGKHTVKVEAIDNKTQEILINKTININIKKYNSEVNIESPADNSISKGLNIEISGWTMSSMCSDNYDVKLLIDNNIIEGITFNKYERNDVNKVVTKYGYNPKPGFKTNIDVSNMKDGKHNLTIQIINKDTDEVLTQTSKTINIKKYYGTIYLESPVKSIFNSSFKISGWEMSTYPNAKIVIDIDNKRIENITRLSRNDVIAAVTEYGSAEQNPTPGFEYNLDLNTYSEGTHNLSIKVVTDDNEIAAEINKKVLFYRNIYCGVDVSSWNGIINFTAAKNDGLDFAIIRMGTSGYGSGKILEDVYWRENVKNALNNNVKVGIYFLSNAITEQEILNEANFLINNLNMAGFSNKIKYPVVFDTEFSAEYPNGRADLLSKEERTRLAKKFLDRIREAGYIPMIYASKSYLYDQLDMSKLQDYEVWVAHYNGTTNPVENPTDYRGIYQIWQYTSTGRFAGINGNVDLNISYKNY